MTVEVERDALVACVRAVVDVVEGRCTIPILANLLLVAEDGRLTITGTNLDMQVSSSVEVTGVIATTVDAQKLLAAATSFKPGRLTITQAEGKSAVTIRQRRGQRTLLTLATADFPKRDALKEARCFTMPIASLSRILDTAHVAQGRDETRYYLIGVFLHASADKMRGVATDGHRMIRAEVALPDGAAGMPDTIVPTSAVAHLRKLLAKREGSVAIEVTRKAMTFAVGETRIVTNVVDGSYPDYQRIIPSAGEHSFRAARDAIIEPVAAIAAVINAEGDRNKVRTIAFDLGGADGHEVRARDQTGTTASEPLAGELTGPPIQFGVNEAYLRSVAGVFAETATLTISTGGPACALLLTSDKDPDLVGIIMPMRI